MPRHPGQGGVLSPVLVKVQNSAVWLEPKPAESKNISVFIAARHFRAEGLMPSTVLMPAAKLPIVLRITV